MLCGLLCLASCPENADFQGHLPCRLCQRLIPFFWGGAVLGLHRYVGFSLAVASRDYSLGALPGLLTAVAPLAVEHAF